MWRGKKFDLLGDFLYRKMAAIQKPPRFFQSQAIEVLLRRATKPTLELTTKLRRTHARIMREFIDTDIRLGAQALQRSGQPIREVLSGRLFEIDFPQSAPAKSDNGFSVSVAEHCGNGIARRPLAVMLGDVG